MQDSAVKVELRSLTVELLHGDAGQNVAVTVGQRAAQVVSLVEEACRHMVERHLLPERKQERHLDCSQGQTGADEISTGTLTFFFHPKDFSEHAYQLKAAHKSHILKKRFFKRQISPQLLPVRFINRPFYVNAEVS